jgi:hypothetical protein
VKPLSFPDEQVESKQCSLTSGVLRVNGYTSQKTNSFVFEMYDTSVLQGGQTTFVRPTWSFEANVPQLTN